MDIKPYTDEIARRMFVVTADQNYLLARLAHTHQLDVDFYWLSLHALEKYFKAILLMNGNSAKHGGHDLVKLHDQVIKLHPKLAFGPLVDSKIDNLHWRSSTVLEFLTRLNELGSAANRYMTYGYVVATEDLVKVDQLIWSVRRHCQPFTWEPRPGDIIDQVEQRIARPDRWALNGLPLEKLMARPDEDALRVAFMRLNTAFDPGCHHTLAGWRASAGNPPLADWAMRLRSLNASTETKHTAAAVLQWALDNIVFEKPDKAEIKAVLDTHGDGVP
jgi:hypothetical protein